MSSNTVISTIAGAMATETKNTNTPKYTLSKDTWSIIAEIDIGIRESKTLGVSWFSPSEYNPRSFKSEIVQEFFAMFGAMTAAEMRYNWCFEFPPRLAIRNCPDFHWEDASTYIRELIKQGLLEKI